MTQSKQPLFSMERLKEAALNKVYEVIFIVFATVVAAFFGLPHIIDDPAQEIHESLGSTASTDTEAEAETETKAEAKPVDQLAAVKDNNVGFRVRPTWGGYFHEFDVLQPGEQEPPFVEVKSGKQNLDWSTHVTTTEGGLLGIGGTDTEWQLKGSLDVTFEQNSLYELLKESEEKFLMTSLHPLINEAAQEAIEEVNLKKLQDEEKAAEKPEKSEKDKLEKSFQQKLNSAFDDKYSVTVNSVELSTVTTLKHADLSDPNLEKLTADDMFRVVKKVETGLGAFRASVGGAIFGAVMLLAALGVLFFLFNH